MSQDGHFRAHGRRQVDLSASLERPPEKDAEPVRIVNLSLAGACVEMGRPVPIGTPVKVEIMAPTLWDPLVLRGRVVWSTEPRGAARRAGVHFEHHEAAHAFALFELLGAHNYEV
jgi:hypothetical protein